MGRASKTNGVVGVIQKVNGGYDWLIDISKKPDGCSVREIYNSRLYPIIYKNRYNHGSGEYVCNNCQTYSQLDGSYISLPGILIPRGMDGPVFLPQQVQGDALAFHPPVHPGPVRDRPDGIGRDRQRGKPFRFERFLAHRPGQRPTDARLLGTADKVRYRDMADSAAAGDLPMALSVCFLHEGLP